jgi:hypothetical protein
MVTTSGCGVVLTTSPLYPDLPLLRSFNASQIRNRLPLPPGGLYELVGSDHLTFLNFPEKEGGMFSLYQGA